MSGAMPNRETFTLTNITISDGRDRVGEVTHVRCKWAMGTFERKSPLPAEGRTCSARDSLAELAAYSTRNYANNRRPIFPMAFVH
jgi:hypothetical protein